MFISVVLVDVGWIVLVLGRSPLQSASSVAHVGCLTAIQITGKFVDHTRFLKVLHLLPCREERFYFQWFEIWDNDGFLRRIDGFDVLSDYVIQDLFISLECR